jgi:hypothetical protein
MLYGFEGLRLYAPQDQRKTSPAPNLSDGAATQDCFFAPAANRGRFPTELATI